MAKRKIDRTEKAVWACFILMIILILMSTYAHAVIIENTASNQNTYKDGELIIITLQANAAGLTVTGDFAAVDSGFNAKSVLVEADGQTYTLSYPITFANSRGDGTYNSIITVYDPQTSTTSTVTYGIRLANIGERLSSTQEIILTVNDEAMISVKSGTVQVCTNTKCTTFTQEEYDAARNIMISSGKVSLSNLTYNQIRDEISAAANAKIDAQLKEYLIQLAAIKGTLDSGIYDLQQTVKDQKNFTEYQKNETIRVLKQGSRNNLISVVAVFIMIAALLYILYLRTETTWFIGPK